MPKYCLICGKKNESKKDLYCIACKKKMVANTTKNETGKMVKIPIIGKVVKDNKLGNRILYYYYEKYPQPKQEQKQNSPQEIPKKDTRSIKGSNEKV